MIRKRKKRNKAKVERLSCFIPYADFEKACIEAVEQGRFKRTFLYYMRGKTKKNDERFAANSPLSLFFYNVSVTAGGYTVQMRLDHVLTFLKLNGNNKDYAGEEILGACIAYPPGRDVPEWRIVYYFNEDGSFKDRNLGSTDHVVARSNGGEDRLYNMQLMRCRANWRKADDENDVFVDADETRRVLEMAQAGLDNMDMSDEKSEDVKRELTELFNAEVAALDTAVK